MNNNDRWPGARGTRPLWVWTVGQVARLAVGIAFVAALAAFLLLGLDRVFGGPPGGAGVLQPDSSDIFLVLLPVLTLCLVFLRGLPAQLSEARQARALRASFEAMGTGAGDGARVGDAVWRTDVSAAAVGWSLADVRDAGAVSGGVRGRVLFAVSGTGPPRQVGFFSWPGDRGRPRPVRSGWLAVVELAGPPDDDGVVEGGAAGATGAKAAAGLRVVPGSLRRVVPPVSVPLSDDPDEPPAAWFVAASGCGARLVTLDAGMQGASDADAEDAARAAIEAWAGGG